jgi:hypothetical protein
MFVGSILPGLLCPLSATAMAKPTTLAPISPWNVDWSATTCSLRRLFGTKERESLLVMERYGPTDVFQLTIVSDEFKSYEQGNPLQLKFGDGKPRRITSVSPGKSVNGTATLFFSSQSLAEPVDHASSEWRAPVTHATEAATTTISVSYFGHERVFSIGPLDKPFDALRKCTDDLVASWGLDPKQQAQLIKKPKPLSSPGSWLSDSDYPAAMRIGGKQALVNFRLSVDASGAPTACEVQRSYNDKKFDEVTCAILLRRARFAPAMDAKDQPVPSFYLNTVRWTMG